MRVMMSLGVAAASVAFLASPGVRAEERLNQQGRLTIAAERLFGVAHQVATIDEGPFRERNSQTSISFLSKPVTMPVTAPRIAADYFVIDGLSVGLGLGYSAVSLHAEVRGTDTPPPDQAGIHAFIVAPRVGYAYMFDEYLGLWPRAGVTYSNISFDIGDGEPSNATVVGSNSFAVSGEVPLVITPVSHVAFLLAPTIDYGVSGESKVTTPNAGNRTVDTNPLDIGLHAGLAVWF